MCWKEIWWQMINWTRCTTTCLTTKCLWTGHTAGKASWVWRHCTSGSRNSKTDASLSTTGSKPARPRSSGWTGSSSHKAFWQVSNRIKPVKIKYRLTQSASMSNLPTNTPWLSLVKIKIKPLRINLVWNKRVASVQACIWKDAVSIQPVLS